jgi:transposase
MYRPFEKSIATTMPNAQWVIDHFHVVMKANEAIDTIRRSLQADMDKTERVNTKKGLAYTLKTRVFDLTPEEASKIRLLRENPKLYPLAVAFEPKPFIIFMNRFFIIGIAQSLSPMVTRNVLTD